MPLDSITVSALAAELRSRIVGAKIDKVQQPERDTVLLTLRGQNGNCRLTVCGGVGNARVHLTSAAYENPAQPPMFCMLLRKHLCGARIAELEQPQRERILIFHLDAYDEMGMPVKKKLAVEMIGRGTNIILIDADAHIIDCLRRVDSDMSSLRQILPGLIYRLPPAQTKPDFFALDSAARREIFRSYHGEPLDKWLLDSFSCLSPVICRELVWRCGGNPEDFPTAMDALADSVAAGEFTPWMLLLDGKPKDFSFMQLGQYGSAAEGECFDCFSDLLDAFYTRRSQGEELRRKSVTLRKTVKSAHDRVARKTAMQLEDLQKTGEREQKRRWGDLITANLYRAPKAGAASMTVEDFYEDDCPEVTVPLDRLKTPQQNAAAYYREYNKAKTAEQYLTRLIAENRKEEQYLSSVLDELDRVASEADIAEIRRELTETGYLRMQKTGKKEKTKESVPLRYISAEGYEILVGRSNIQNDRLTTKLAHKGDLWFHTKTVHGSHVIVRCAGAAVSDETIRDAAVLAANHSQASEGGKVAVDYTPVKFVKKPAGAMPGMVVYTDYASIVVEADLTLEEKLKA